MQENDTLFDDATFEEMKASQAKKPESNTDNLLHWGENTGIPRTRGEYRANRRLSMVLPESGLVSALSANQFKNRFEEGGEAGVGGNSNAYVDVRVSAENEHFGIPEDAPGSARPVYGFMRHKDDHMGILNNTGLYGDLMVDLKEPKPGQKVTTTIGDSLNNYGAIHRHYDEDWRHWEDEETIKERDDLAETVNAKRSPEPLDESHLPEYEDSNSQDVLTGVPYREIQWHDRPIPREDIEAVHANYKIYEREGYPQTKIDQIVAAHKEAADKLRAAGLPNSTPVISRTQFAYTLPTLFPDIKGDVVVDTHETRV